MNNSLAKAYLFKAAYTIMASLINVLTVLTTKNIGMLFVGLFMFLGACISDNYFKSTGNKATIICRRIGYIVPSSAFFIYLLWCIVGVYSPSAYKLLFSNIHLILIIILSIVNSFISFVDIWLYGFNKEQHEQREKTNQYMKEQREKERNLTNEVVELRKREHREFIISKNRRG